MYPEEGLVCFQINALNDRISQNFKRDDLDNEWKEYLYEIYTKNENMIKDIKLHKKDYSDINQNFNKNYQNYILYESYIFYKNEIDILSKVCLSFFSLRNININKPLITVGERDCIKFGLCNKNMITIPSYDLCNPVAILVNLFHEIGHYIILHKKFHRNVFDFKKYGLGFCKDTKNWTPDDNLIWTQELLADGLIVGLVGPVYLNTFSKYGMIIEAHSNEPSNDLRFRFCEKIINSMDFISERFDWERKLQSFIEHHKYDEERYSSLVSDFYGYYSPILNKEYIYKDRIKNELILANFFSEKIKKLEKLENIKLEPLVALLSACIAINKSDEFEAVIKSGYESLEESCLTRG